ncbi:MAG: hypothetical protein Q8K63_09155 [Acidimicrobiales bacterium]|nr:hypothetical protein [Acidimicrobiales bacterium]
MTEPRFRQAISWRLTVSDPPSHAFVADDVNGHVLIFSGPSWNRHRPNSVLGTQMEECFSALGRRKVDLEESLRRSGAGVSWRTLTNYRTAATDPDPEHFLEGFRFLHDETTKIRPPLPVLMEDGFPFLLATRPRGEHWYGHGDESACGECLRQEADPWTGRVTRDGVVIEPADPLGVCLQLPAAALAPHIGATPATLEELVRRAIDAFGIDPDALRELVDHRTIARVWIEKEWIANLSPTGKSELYGPTRSTMHWDKRLLPGEYLFPSDFPDDLWTLAYQHRDEPIWIAHAIRAFGHQRGNVPRVGPTRARLRDAV